MTYSFSTPKNIGGLISVSPSYLRDRRREGDWQEGIHWVYLNPKNPRSGIRYNTKLCMHWFACKDRATHEAAIKAYLDTLQPSLVNS